MCTQSPKVTADRAFNGFGTNFEGSPEPLYGNLFLPRKFKVRLLWRPAGDPPTRHPPGMVHGVPCTMPCHAMRVTAGGAKEPAAALAVSRCIEGSAALERPVRKQPQGLHEIVSPVHRNMDQGRACW